MTTLQNNIKNTNFYFQFKKKLKNPYESVINMVHANCQSVNSYEPLIRMGFFFEKKIVSAIDALQTTTNQYIHSIQSNESTKNA